MGEHTRLGLLDGGAECGVIDEPLVALLRLPLHKAPLTLNGFAGSGSTTSPGWVDLTFQLGGVEMSWPFRVVQQLRRRYSLILGLDWQRAAGAVTNHREATLSFSPTQPSRFTTHHLPRFPVVPSLMVCDRMEVSTPIHPEVRAWHMCALPTPVPPCTLPPRPAPLFSLPAAPHLEIPPEVREWHMEVPTTLRPTTLLTDCTICGVKVPQNPTRLQQHVQGKRHLYKWLKLQQYPLPPPLPLLLPLPLLVADCHPEAPPDIPKVACTICGVHVHKNPHHLKQHAQGKRHLQKLWQLQTSSIPPPHPSDALSLAPIDPQPLLNLLIGPADASDDDDDANLPNIPPPAAAPMNPLVAQPAPPPQFGPHSVEDSQEDFFIQLHTASHWNSQAMIKKCIQRDTTWPGYHTAIEKFYNKCLICDHHNNSPSRSESKTEPLPSTVCTTWAVDFFEVQPDVNGCNLVLSMADPLSGTIEAAPLRTTSTAHQVWAAIQTHLIDKHTAPLELRMDKDPKYGHPVSTKLQQLGVRVRDYPPNTQKHNPIGERNGGTLKRAVRKSMQAAHEPVDLTVTLPIHVAALNDMPRRRLDWHCPDEVRQMTSAELLPIKACILRHRAPPTPHVKHRPPMPAYCMVLVARHKTSLQHLSPRTGPFACRPCPHNHLSCRQVEKFVFRTGEYTWRCVDVQKLRVLRAHPYQLSQSSVELAAVVYSSDAGLSSEDAEFASDRDVGELETWKTTGDLDYTSPPDLVSSDDSDDDAEHNLNIAGLSVTTADGAVFGGEAAAQFWQDVSLKEVDANTIPADRLKVKLELKPDAVPVFTKPFPVPLHLQEVKKVIIEDLERLNKIERAGPGEYNAPFFLRKEVSADGTEEKYRPLVDYSPHSRVLRTQQFPIPNLNMVLQRISPSLFRTIIDLCNGFHQLLLDECSREFLAFTVDGVRYRWRVLPFGLAQAPTIFQAWMRASLEDLIAEGWCEVYIDDIIIHSASMAEHIEHCIRLRTRLQELGLKINPKKVQHMRTAVKVLGHMVEQNLISPLTDYKEALLARPMPTTDASWGRYVGGVGWLSKFIPHLSQKLAKVHLSRSPDDWTDLQQAISNSVALQPLQIGSGELVLHTDASDLGWGACLQQHLPPNMGGTRILGFASGKWDDAQSRWMVREKECFAIVKALRFFYVYCWGAHVTVHTDHKSLAGSGLRLNRKVNINKVLGWKEELSGWHLTFVHVKGDENGLADYLSRPVDVDADTAWWANQRQLEQQQY